MRIKRTPRDRQSMRLIRTAKLSSAIRQTRLQIQKTVLHYAPNDPRRATLDKHIRLVITRGLEEQMNAIGDPIVSEQFVNRILSELQFHRLEVVRVAIQQWAAKEQARLKTS